MTTSLKSGALRHDIHYWLGKDTSQDEAGAAAIKTVELDAALGGRAVQYREVPFARSSLSHDDIFILDTKSKIFQFNGSNSSIQERAKALEVVQYIKDTYHDGKCEVAAIEDGKLMADADTGEFWGFFGGFAPLPRKTTTDEDKIADSPTKLFWVEKGQAEPVDTDSLTRELLDTYKCYILDCGLEVFVWMGRNTSLDERKVASGAAESSELIVDDVNQELVRGADRPKSHIIRVIALLRRQGVNVKGLLKAAPAKEEPQPYIDVTGNLQVWRVDGKDKVLLDASDHSKFYGGDCYIFQYSYPGEDKEEYLIGTWFGKKSVEARIYEGNEPIQFFTILQSFIVFKGGLSTGYKNYIAETELPDETYKEDSVALFRVQGSGPDNMQSIQVEPVASSLNSSYCYILHNDSSVFTWSGNLTTSDDHELVERQLDLIKPNVQSKPQKEGSESEQFWDLLGGKTEYPSQKLEGKLKRILAFSLAHSQTVAEIYNFTQDDLMTEDIYILDCHSEIFVWVGQEVDSRSKLHALTIGEGILSFSHLHADAWKLIPEKLAIVKNGGTPIVDKPKRRTPVSYGGRSSVPEKSQRSRSMSFSPERVRVRGSYNALSASFEQPPPARQVIMPRSVKASPERPKSTPEKSTPESNNKENSISSRIESLTIQEDVKEGEVEDEEGLPIFPYERLKISSTDPVTEIDVTKRETYLSSAEFREKFGMAKDAFYKMPKWKQNNLKWPFNCSESPSYLCFSFSFLQPELQVEESLFVNLYNFFP
ncbi:hypothetical protein GH714_004455 [Hevea brasiliensis]|uniref:HP domain-containing protein n=1 Tax=Hevea brasiliensis TaxID=3981 RepID=A0A6A6M7H2_HEVBR|nr:hypothetical protein GH714_004455 [Hevea brasiliensis]